ncbi:hypothetical protein ACFV0O_03925 [Kitasatospora sp. NPDC059577]|uniref:hypothetical protein n=1 Tax=Kitasatospora sp. NPDC059577 TaxID=3346873 RepID=UPI0036CF46A1
MTAEFIVAPVFDLVDPLTGPAFHEDHPVIGDEGEREALAAYLASAVVVLMTPSLMADVLDPERPGGVPMNYRCDGRWIWTDTVTYYLDRYGLAPEPGLLAYVRERLAAGEAPAPLASEVRERVVDFLLAPAAAGQETVWEIDEA